MTARGAIAALLLGVPSLAGGASIGIEHAPLTCVPVDRYARIAARASAPVGQAELQFRAAGDDRWYSVRMIERGGEWSASLPRPTSALREIDYRIVMTAPDAGSVETPTARVQVAPTCDSAAASSLNASILVTVPPGAPAVPPVPAGFSPAGVVADGRRTRSSNTIRIAGAVAGAAVLGATAIVVAGSSSEPEENGPPGSEFGFNGTTPGAGSVLSPNRDTLTILMAMTRGPSILLPLNWRVEVGSAGRVCLTMAGRHHVVAGPQSLALSSPLAATGEGGCGTQFETDNIRITIARQAEPIYQETIAVPFRFVP